MDWSKGISASYKAYIVDPITWRDTDEIEIISGSISKTEDDLRESASITVRDYDSEYEQWIRIYLDARQVSDSYYGPIFTGLVSSPGKDIEGTVQTNSLQCYSVLKPANDILLPKGYYVSYGTDIANILTSLLSVIQGINVHVEGDPGILQQTIIAENNETNLSMASKILYSTDWRMYITGDGTIVVTDVTDESSAYFDSDEYDCLETRVTIDNNWFDCPNVFRAVDGNFSATAMDNDPDSPLSIQNRGREIWMEETNCTPYLGESLNSYAKRRLEEEQMVSYSVSYTRRFVPDVNVSDVVTLHYPAQNIMGDFYISSQNITLGYSPSVSEVVYRI